jgi:predicted TIM-barrel fold metal-dependent hydrolase
MDRNGVERGLVSVGSEAAREALQRHPDRFIPSTAVDPNVPMEAVRRIVADHEQFGVRAVSVFPAGLAPQVAINDKKIYPVYAKCVELGLSVWVNTGVPVPRLRYECQYTGLIDEVMADFPDLVFVMMHGAEPWTDLAVKLMLKWPGLHYATSAFAPKYYPADIVQYANTRGADKVLYAGYFPMGLTLERIVAELHEVAFRDHVWAKFLRHNALRVLGLS